MNKAIMPSVGDVAHCSNGEKYRIEAADYGFVMVNIRSGARHRLTPEELSDMADGDRYRIVSPTESTVGDIDELSENATYRYSHADPGDESRTFSVNLDYVDADDFAGYGEGAVQFHYQDGYVADLPVSNVEFQIDAHMIERVD